MDMSAMADLVDPETKARIARLMGGGGGAAQPGGFGAPAAAAAPPPQPYRRPAQGRGGMPPPPPVCEGVLKGLEQDDELNDERCTVLGWRPARQRWLVSLPAEGGDGEEDGEELLLVRNANLGRERTVATPRGWAEDGKGRMRPGPAPPPAQTSHDVDRMGGGAVVQFRDVDGDTIDWELAGGGAARYAVNGAWRPPACAVEFFCSGRPRRPGPHLRVDCDSAGYRVIDLPSPGAADALIPLLDAGGVRSSRAVFFPGEAVLLTQELSFADGSVCAEAHEKAVVLRAPGDAPDTAEVVVPSGEHFDVAVVDLARCRELDDGVEVELRREVPFASGRAPAPVGLVVRVARLARPGHDVEQGHAEVVWGDGDDDALYFDVNQLWLRPLDGREVS